MVDIKKFFKTYKPKAREICTYFSGKPDVMYTRKSNVLRDNRHCRVVSWTVQGNSNLTLACHLAEQGDFESLTIAKLCGCCRNKDLFIRVDGGEERHLYSTIPGKDSRLVRKWWIDENKVVNIQTWPIRAGI